MWLKSLLQNAQDRKRCQLVQLQDRVSDLERQLMVDTRTGIPSRQYFFDHFAQHARPGDYVVLLDIDDFQSVNIDYGHLVGDRLLRIIAGAIDEAIAGRGIVARLEWDEFLVLSRGVRDSEISALVDSILQAVRTAAVTVGELTVTRKATAGVVSVTCGMTVSEALTRADWALVAARKAGGKRAVFMTGGEMPARRPRPSVEEVRLALQRGEIGYHVQPIVDLSTLRPQGYEALVRWQRPTGEVIGPAQFLDTMTSAYDARTKPPLDAAHRTAAWAAHERDVFISFNISTSFLDQVAHHGVDWVSTLVGDVPYDRVVFELVETIVDCDKDRICEVVAALRDRGIRVALDDFGIGRSTLERLQKIPVDIVKVDKHFLHMAERSPRDMEILRGMVDLSRSTGAISVVEGVETERHLDVARALGADWAQGYLFGRPAAIPEFMACAG
ncbi:phosphodiesterase [Maliponia aquimaris]|nr:phosphodiesterase [Maliponia aquimaris]